MGARAWIFSTEWLPKMQEPLLIWKQCPITGNSPLEKSREFSLEHSDGFLNSLMDLLPGDSKEMGSLGPWNSCVWGWNEEQLWFLTSLVPGHWVLAVQSQPQRELDEGPCAAAGAKGARTDLQSWGQTASGRQTQFSPRWDGRPWAALVQLLLPGLSIL